MHGDTLHMHADEGFEAKENLTSAASEPEVHDDGGPGVSQEGSSLISGEEFEVNEFLFGVNSW